MILCIALIGHYCTFDLIPLTDRVFETVLVVQSGQGIIQYYFIVSLH